MKYPKNKFAIAAGAGLLAVAAILFFSLSGTETEKASAAKREPGTRAVTKRPASRKTLGTARSANAKSSAPRKAVKPILDIDDDDDNRTPEEKALAKDIETALDEEDLELARRCAAAALACKDPEIRQAMIDTLGWFGAQALAELTPFMADPDEDVRDSAQTEWSMALSDIEDDEEKVSTVEMAMLVISDEDVLDDISSEYIGLDEKLAVDSLLRIIEANGSGAAKARETYEFVTGEEFTSREDAERWIEEEYSPSEDD